MATLKQTDKEKIEQLEAQVARLHSQYHGAKGAAHRFYELNRQLENRVRKVIVVGERVDTDELFKLRALVPDEPRPKSPWSRKRITR